MKKPARRNSKIAKVPTIMQLEALECGAACLDMVSAYYGKWIPLEEVRKDCGVSRDGSNAKNVYLAAEKYGFEVDAFRYETESIREEGNFPCIIHWNFNHFVVLDGFRGNYAYLNDPARGSYKVSMSDFDDAFTGICIEMKPGENFKKSGTRPSIFSFSKRSLHGATSAMVFSIIITVLASLFALFQPAFSKVFLDEILTNNSPDWFYPFLYILSGVSLLQIIVSILNGIYQLRLKGKLDSGNSASFFWKTLHLPLEFFSQRSSGDLQERQRSNGLVASQFVEIFAPLVINLAMMILYLVVMVNYSWLLSLIGVAATIINVFTAKMVSKARLNLTRVALRDESKLSASTVAGIGMMETIKSSGSENGFFERWSGYQAAVSLGREKSKRLNCYSSGISLLVNGLTNVIIMVLGIYLAMKGQITIGTIMAFQGFLLSFTDPVSALIESGQSYQEMRAKMERIDDVMKYPNDPLMAGKEVQGEVKKLSGNLEIKDISFGYSPLEKPLIEHFSLSLKPGKMVALVGGSGSGKSTMAKLISGLYAPWKGTIEFDGKQISNIDPVIFRSSLSVVDQDITLFEDSIANNIKMWDPSIEDFEMIMAAKDAQIHQEILRREGGYMYKIRENGKDFSGGERQRLEIARVLAGDPTIVILDEATSALDALTEFEVVKAIRERGITVIVVAHRLSTIKNADEIIVLNKGKVVERGTHSELYAKKGEYYNLIESD